MHRKRGVRKEYRGESALVTMPTEAELDDLWSNERRQVILREALIELQSTSKMADRTIRAFEMLVFHHRPVTDIAAELNMTENDIYLAKSRVAAKLRDTVQTLEAAFDEDGL